MTAREQDSGVSLLELVAVLAIFSLIAVMSLQLLTGALHTQNRLAEAQSHTPRLSAALAVLRRDIETMQPVSGLPGFRFSATDNQLALVTGQADATSQQVTWQLDPGGALTRRAAPLGQDTPAPPVLMAEDITAWELRVAQPGGPWTAASGQISGATPLPAGVAVELDHRALGAIRLVAAR